MKKSGYPNRGHLLSDFYVTGISRAYRDAQNLMLVFESPTGIETPNEILKNEVARFVIPVSVAEKMSSDLTEAVNKLIEHEIEEQVEIVQDQDMANKEVLGAAFKLS